ncbi:DUF1697 domain-containing protein [Microbacterium sp. 2FI]|uniref:DUF1697 domain-containing protein n=1 Tax=Microbacterium sp. 2FI TaxID=2502193 RepID=UPI00148594EB|nr:DUF1697 domain-containing protein [Microbacterium sp. 2FI]
MRHVAFLRNVNQGQQGHPSTDDLRRAFAEAGCTEVVPFQSNGTVVFEATDPEQVVADAVAALAARSGTEREAFRMPMHDVVRLVEAHSAEPDAQRRELTLHGGSAIDLRGAANVREAARRRCVIAETGEGWAVSINERDHESNATPTLERITGLPATSRGLPTLVRLVARFG